MLGAYAYLAQHVAVDQVSRRRVRHRIGIAFALVWSGPPREIVAWSIVLSNATRTVLYLGLGRV
jgi:hypothetical protein